MKKSLILLPLAAFLSGCMLLPGKNSQGGGGSNSQGGSGGGDSGSFQPGDSEEPAELPDAHDSSFPTSGTVFIDFLNEGATYKDCFPYVTETTGVEGSHIEGMAMMANGCYVGKDGNQALSYMFMKNKDRSAKGLSFFGNCVSLGAITKVEIGGPNDKVTISNAQDYYITLSKDMTTSAATSGTKFSSPIAEGSAVTASESDGYGFFKISTVNSSKNGHIGYVKVTYKIS